MAFERYGDIFNKYCSKFYKKTIDGVSPPWVFKVHVGSDDQTNKVHVKKQNPAQ